MSASPSDGHRVIWAVRPSGDGTGLLNYPLDADLSKCTVCMTEGVVAFALTYHQVIDFTTTFGEPEILIPTDSLFCATCAPMVERDAWAELVQRRLIYFAGDGTRSGADRKRFVEIEFALLRRALKGRGLVYVDLPRQDFRLMYRADFAAGTLPVKPVSDGREPDAHRWLDDYRDVSLDEIEALKEEFRRRYAFAIPGREAIETIARHASDGVVEIGAGNGYWAFLLRNFGVRVEAYDAYPVNGSSNTYWSSKWPKELRRIWTDVRIGDESMLERVNPAKTLLLVWPPMAQEAGYRILRAYRGETVCYVGDWRGATGDIMLHNFLKLAFRLVETVRIPTWYGFTDQLMVFKRLSMEEAAANMERGQALLKRDKAELHLEVIERLMDQWGSA